MSDFTFTCSNCGQQLVADTSKVGTTLNCSYCQTPLLVPNLAAAPPPAPPMGPRVSSPQSGPYAPRPTISTANVPEKTSGLAIASLICSLSSFLTCIGWIPGIICGHLAKAQMRRDTNLKGSGMATAGLVIGYVLLALNILGLVFFAAAFKRSVDYVNQQKQQSRIDVSPSEQPVATEDGEDAQPDPLYTLSLNEAQIPDRPAAGKIGGSDFTVESAKLENGILTIRQGKEFMADKQFMIFLFLRAGENIEGKSFNFTADKPAIGSPTPHIHTTWRTRESGVKSHVYMKDYAMRIEFGTASNGKIPTKIYLCLPDKQKSYVAGSFDTELKKN